MVDHGLLTITARFDQIPRTRVRVDYEVRRAGESLPLVTGHVTLCFFHTGRQRPVVAPPQVRALFERVLHTAPH